MMAESRKISRTTRIHIVTIVLGTCLILTGCSSSSPRGWYDSRYEDAMETAETVFRAGHPSQAAGQYQKALRYAVLADQGEAIYEAGFGLALMQLRQDHDAEALQNIGIIEHLLGDYGTTHGGAEGRTGRINARKRGLDLIRATVFYRQKNWQAARASAFLSRHSKDQTIAMQSEFLLGLIAFEQGESAALQSALTILKGSRTVENTINRQELEACAAILAQDWAKAEPALDALIQARRGQQDYSAMRRALQLQSHVAARQGKWAEAHNLEEQRKQSAQAELENPVASTSRGRASGGGGRH